MSLPGHIPAETYKKPFEKPAFVGTQHAASLPGRSAAISLLVIARVLRMPGIALLLVLMFAQQAIFFGFEALLGLFTLSRLGLLGQGNGLIFLVVGLVLVVVQVRYIGRWSRQYGEARLVTAALGLLAAGLILVALTPEQPHPLYVKQIAEYELLNQSPDSTEAIIGKIRVKLPDDDHNGVWGVAWILVAIIPVAVGAGLIRPNLNSLMTKRVDPADYGSVLGVSSAFVSAANACAPLIGGVLFQQFGSTLPFLLGGVLMAGLAALSAVQVKQPAAEAQNIPRAVDG